MAYQVLARKWRPRSFDTMVGQGHVLRALVNALDKQTLHHAYLFTGTRGVGKTTVARVFAKALNCETGISSTPCGECSACREIDSGRFVDLIEVDAASRTGVDDTRELLDNVQYTPTQGRFKVYLIDEVHMFSNHSFNALLKTLEEPPPHVKFLLATTDPQKLLPTILSRCLQFNLKRLSMDEILGQLAHVLDEEGIAYELPALALIARAADGSMRDGLSLLDQAIGFGGGEVGEADVQAMLGSISRDHVFGVLEELAAQDSAALMRRIADLAQQGPDYAAWLADLITALQRIALIQQIPEALDDSLGDPQRLQALATRLSPEDTQLYYQIALMGRRDLPLSPEPRGGFEMTLLRMLAFRPLTVGGGGSAPVSSPASSPAGPGGAAAATGQATAAAAPVSSAPAPDSVPAATAAAAPGARSVPQPEATSLSAGGAVSPLAGARAMLGKQQAAASLPFERPGQQPDQQPDQQSSGPVRPAAPETVETPSAAPASAVAEVVPPWQQERGSSSATADLPPEMPLHLPANPSPDWPPPDDSYQPPPDAELYAQKKTEPDAALTTETGQQSPAQPVAPVDSAAPAAPVAPAASSSVADKPLSWLELMPQLGLEGVVQALAAHCVQQPADDGGLMLALDPAKSGLLNNDRIGRIQAALEQLLGSAPRLQIAVAKSDQFSPAMMQQQARQIRLQQAEQSIADDALVQAMQQRLGASVQPDSVRPLD